MGVLTVEDAKSSTVRLWDIANEGSDSMSHICEPLQYCRRQKSSVQQSL